jgi:hypothetical protein
MNNQYQNSEDMRYHKNTLYLFFFKLKINGRSYVNVKSSHGSLSFDMINGFGFMVLNAAFNNISAISWRSVLLVEETGVPRENQHVK